MAKLNVYQSVDMSGNEISVGEVTYNDENLVIIEGESTTTYYMGRFNYDNNQWNGAVERIQIFYNEGTEIYDLRGIEIDPRFFSSEITNLETLQKIFQSDDRILGSHDADVLISFSGDDVIRGGGGDDALQGKRGDDALRGGGGDDALRGGTGRDVLDGGGGDDLLRGGEGRDVFVFDERDGRDVVRDFQNRRDKIEIEGGATDFDKIEITEVDGDAHVAFGRTEITLRDVDIDALGRADFLFV